MPITLGQNIASLIAQRRLGEATTAVGRSLERLSSGLRINGGRDDAAGLAVSTNLKVDARVLGRAVLNANDGISSLNVASESLGTLSSITMRQLELATQAANGNYSVAQRRAMHTEANALAQEFNRIVATTSFNSQNLFAIGSRPQETRWQLGYGLANSIGFTFGSELERLIGDGTFVTSSGQTAGGASGGEYVTLDLDGDGNLDVVRGSSSFASIQVAFGNGDGTFDAQVSIAVGSVNRSLVVADLNGDGRGELVVFGTSGAELWQFDSNRNAASTNLGVQSTGAGAVGDVTGDGVADLVIAQSGSYFVATGNGNGTFGAFITAGTYSTTGSVTEIQLHDLNGDGRLDIIGTSSTPATQLIVTLGSGSGTFTSSVTQPNFPGGGGAVMDSMTLGDFNRDGILDIVVSVPGNTGLLLGNGDGTFASAVTIANGPYVTANVADFNGDGYADLFLSRQTGSLIMFGNGDGTFGTQVTLTGGGWGATVGDFNNDGVIDATGGAQVYLSNTTTSAAMQNLYLLTTDEARASIELLNQQLTRITLEIGAVGAQQSRLNSAVKTILATKENYLQAASRIEDADVAFESAQLIRQQILQNASLSILAQANLQPSLVLKLLS